MLRLAAAAALTACLASSALADVGADSQFVACDGFQAATRSTDGVTFVRGNPLLASFVYPRVKQPPGGEGVAACTRALADPRLVPEYHVRRASLLRARAMHHLADGDTTEALRDTDEAARLINDVTDPHVRRSVGLGIDLVRALAFRLQGEQAAAETLALEAWRRRPFCRAAAYGALLAVGADASAETLTPLLRRLAQLNPEALKLLDPAKLGRGEFDRNLLRQALTNPVLELFHALPDATNDARVPSYRPNPLVDTGGLFNLKGPRLGVLRIGYRHAFATGDVAEEMALLRAAELALVDKRRGVVVMERLDEKVTVNTMHMGMVVRSDPGGYQTTLDIALNPTPDTITGAPDLGWRVLDAAEVYADLAPLYLPEGKRTPRR